MEIRLSDIGKQYGDVTAVDNLSIEIADGELVCLLGPSGCGKSTILLMLAGLIEPTGGQIYFDAELMNGVEAEDRDIGMVFQNYALYPHMTVRENIAFPLKMRKADKKFIQEKIGQVAALLQLEPLLKRKPSELSGGQQQRVAIARALVKEPGMLLLDEPFSNLDARLRIELRDEIRSLQKSLGITTIFVTHDQEEAMSISDRILLLDQGRMQQYATPRDMYRSPANRFVGGFLGNPPMNFYRCQRQADKILLLGDNNASYATPSNLCRFAPEPAYETCGIRAEDISVTDSGEGLAARVIGTQTLGREIYIKLELLGREATACLPWDKDYRVGDTIPVTIKQLYVF